MYHELSKDVPILFGLDQHIQHRCFSDEVFRTFTLHILNIKVPVKYKLGVCICNGLPLSFYSREPR